MKREEKKIFIPSKNQEKEKEKKNEFYPISKSYPHKKISSNKY